MHYSCFGFDLDPAILASFASFELREVPLVLVSCLPLIFIISPHLALFSAVFLGTKSLLCSSCLTSLSFDIYYHRSCCFELRLSQTYVPFRIILLRSLYLNPTPSSLFSSLKGPNPPFTFVSVILDIYYLSTCVSELSYDITIIFFQSIIYSQPNLLFFFFYIFFVIM